jgi:hypothetical protein
LLTIISNVHYGVSVMQSSGIRFMIYKNTLFIHKFIARKLGRLFKVYLKYSKLYSNKKGKYVINMFLTLEHGFYNNSCENYRKIHNDIQRSIEIACYAIRSLIWVKSDRFYQFVFTYFILLFLFNIFLLFQMLVFVPFSENRQSEWTEIWTQDIGPGLLE